MNLYNCKNDKFHKNCCNCCNCECCLGPQGEQGPTGTFNPGDVLFYINGNGGPIPIKFGEDVNFISPDLNINLFDNPAAVEINGKLMETAFGGLYSNAVQSFTFTDGNQSEQVQFNHYLPSFNVGENANELQIFIPGEYENQLYDPYRPG